MPSHDDALAPSIFAAAAQASRDALVALTRCFVQIPSPTTEEEALAAEVLATLKRLGYDEAFTDELGNVVGRLRGDGTGPSVLFAVHLDHGATADREGWRFDPFSAEVADGAVHGCGAADNKGALAAMLLAGALARQAGGRQGGDFIVAGIVQSQAHGNIGIRYLVDRTLPGRGIHYDLAVFGNPTGLNVHLGQRGRLAMTLTTIGRVCHAGAPWLGSNAIHEMVPVLGAVQELASSLPSHPFLDRSTLAVTAIESGPGGTATIPDRCAVTLDRRFLPSEGADAVVWQVQSIVSRLAAAEPAIRSELEVRKAHTRSWTGTTQEAACLMHPFTTEADHALVRESVAALEAVGQAPRLGRWQFPTDAGYVAAVKKVVTIGYAPGDEHFAQTPFERVEIDRLVAAAAGYAAISRRISG
ncbi:MAG: M20/M25/M40 family metallo-hydrolase [Candidatus Sericytochromatia bacterium]|nr:M20/M25/M40 family metallo-hydrolase [Candidatus Sericytochromatia bacterium]